MQPRITNKKKLWNLPWPDDVPVLGAPDIDSYFGTLGRNRKHLHEWVKSVFVDEENYWETSKLRDQFLYVLQDVMMSHCDPRDRHMITLADVPTTKGYQTTKAPYSPAEVAEWWNEALRKVGYDV